MNPEHVNVDLVPETFSLFVPVSERDYDCEVDFHHEVQVLANQPVIDGNYIRINFADWTITEWVVYDMDDIAGVEMVVAAFDEQYKATGSWMNPGFASIMFRAIVTDRKFQGRIMNATNARAMDRIYDMTQGQVDYGFADYVCRWVDEHLQTRA